MVVRGEMYAILLTCGNTCSASTTGFVVQKFHLSIYFSYKPVLQPVISFCIRFSTERLLPVLIHALIVFFILAGGYVVHP